MSKDKDTDYLVYIPFGAGGSWARGSDMERQKKRAKEFLKSDWGSYYVIDESQTKMYVYDVTDFECLKVGSQIGYTNEDCDGKGVYFGDDKFIEEVTLDQVKA